MMKETKNIFLTPQLGGPEETMMQYSKDQGGIIEIETKDMDIDAAQIGNHQALVGFLRKGVEQVSILFFSTLFFLPLATNAHFGFQLNFFLFLFRLMQLYARIKFSTVQFIGNCVMKLERVWLRNSSVFNMPTMFKNNSKCRNF